MWVSLHVRDESVKIATRGLHDGPGGFVMLETKSDNIAFHTDDLPALAVAFAEASQVAMNLSRQELNQKVRPLPGLQPIAAKVELLEPSEV